MNLLGLENFTALQLTEVAGVAFGSAIIGGLSGYGTGLILPLVLVPTIGAEATVPVIAVAAILTNLSRATTFYDFIDWRKFRLMLPLALAAVWLAARFFTTLDQRAAGFVIGGVLIALVPLRRILQAVRFKLGNAGLVAGGGVYGLVTGTSAGAGVILVSILMAAGLEGRGVVATDAVISVVLGTMKASTFWFYGAMPLPRVVMGLAIGLCAMPGAFVAKAIAHRLTPKAHDTLLDATVILGGLILIVRNFWA